MIFVPVLLTLKMSLNSILPKLHRCKVTEHGLKHRLNHKGPLGQISKKIQLFAGERYPLLMHIALGLKLYSTFLKIDVI